MTSKSRWPALVSALLIVTLSGCAAAPSSSPSPGFTSEAEAFAAAEETYRAYVDALNDVDLSNPDTFEAVYAWTTGEASAGAREEFSRMHANDWAVTGHTVVALVEPAVAAKRASRISLDVCLDVSGVVLVDGKGRSAVEPDREDLQAFRVSFTTQDSSPTELRIAAIDGRVDGPQCES